MPKLSSVINHMNYLGRQKVVGVLSITLALAALFVGGSVVRAGNVALENYGYGNAGTKSYLENGGYPVATPRSTPCPWWNNSYKCRWSPSPSPSTAIDQTYGYGSGQRQCNCRQQDTTNAAVAGDENGGYPALSSTSSPTASPLPPEPDTAATPAAPSSSSSSSATATANVVTIGYKPMSTVRVPAARAAPAAAAPAIELPQTGPVGGVMNIIGMGSLAGTAAAYVASRRDLSRHMPYHP